MKTGRSTTLQERIRIVEDCLASGLKYGEIAAKYQVSYQQARNWTLRYKELGAAGLEDRRGRPKRQQQPRTQLEAALIEVDRLRYKLFLAERENRQLRRAYERERRKNAARQEKNR